jgi:hypothetical protein
VQVEVVDRGRFDGDDDLARTGSGVVELPEAWRLPVLVEDRGVHPR